MDGSLFYICLQPACLFRLSYAQYLACDMYHKCIYWSLGGGPTDGNCTLWAFYTLLGVEVQGHLGPWHLHFPLPGPGSDARRSLGLGQATDKS